MGTEIINALGSTGLASASGLNPWLPGLLASLAARFGVIELTASHSWMGEWPVIAVMAALFIADFVGDKIPVVDHGLHVVGTVVHPLVGAVIFGAQTNAVSDVSPMLGWAVGGGLSGGFHLVRSGLRPLVTALTSGLGNWVASTIEDVSSLFLALAAIVIPLLAGVIALVTFAMMIRVYVRMRAKRASADASDPIDVYGARTVNTSGGAAGGP